MFVLVLTICAHARIPITRMQATTPTFDLTQLTSSDFESLKPLELAQLLHISVVGGTSRHVACGIAQLPFAADAVLDVSVTLGWPASVSALLDAYCDGATMSTDLHAAATSILDLSASLVVQRPLDEEEAQAEEDAMILALLSSRRLAAVDALARALCDRACVLTDAMISRGRQEEAREMCAQLLPALPEDAPSASVLLTLAALHRRAGDEEAAVAAARRIVLETEWMAPPEELEAVAPVAVAPVADEQLLLAPEDMALLRCRASALCMLREYERAFSLLRRAARFSRHPWASAESPVSRYKLTHDLEQLAHLRASGALTANAADAARAAYTDALDAYASSVAADAAPGDDAILANLPEATQRLLTTPRYIPPSLAASWRGRAALRPRPAAEWEAISRAYDEEELVVLDDFLTDEALEHLRDLSRGATLWHDDKGHYVGAYDFVGFAPSCVAQLAHELTAALPSVIGLDTLTRFWGYKYDATQGGSVGAGGGGEEGIGPAGAGGGSEEGEEAEERATNTGIGIGAHIDPARANLNFWVTPDESNLEPRSGGMVVWRKTSSDADDATMRRLYNTYCADTHACDTLERALGLDDPTVGRSVVAYKCNRCVLFKSHLFHKTDECVFRPEYASSRINLTMLFGYADALRS